MFFKKVGQRATVALLPFTLALNWCYCDGSCLCCCCPIDLSSINIIVVGGGPAAESVIVYDGTGRHAAVTAAEALKTGRNW